MALHGSHCCTLTKAQKRDVFNIWPCSLLGNQITVFVQICIKTVCFTAKTGWNICFELMANASFYQCYTETWMQSWLCYLSTFVTESGCQFSFAEERLTNTSPSPTSEQVSSMSIWIIECFGRDVSGETTYLIIIPRNLYLILTTSQEVSCCFRLGTKFHCGIPVGPPYRSNYTIYGI